MAKILVAEEDDSLRALLVMRLSPGFPRATLIGVASIVEVRRQLQEGEVVAIVWSSGSLIDGSSIGAIMQVKSDWPRIINVGCSSDMANQQRDAGCEIIMDKSKLAQELPTQIIM